MTLRESLGGDVQRIHELVDALLDKEDGILALFDGGRVVSYAQGFGASASQLEFLSPWSSSVRFATWSAHSRPQVQEKGGLVKGIKELGALMVVTGMAAALLTAFFDWRNRLLSRFAAGAEGEEVTAP